MRLDDRIKVCIRGLFGSLGNRLYISLQSQQDIVTAAGIVHEGPILHRAIQTLDTRNLPEYIFFDGSASGLERINAGQTRVKFAPLKDDLGSLVDVLVDATNLSKGSQGNLPDFEGVKIIQASAYPMGALVAPPFTPLQGNNLYLNGDCIISALSPILYAVKDILSGVKLNALTQYTKALKDKPRDEVIHAVYIQNGNLIEMYRRQIKQLLHGNIETSVLPINQIPALKYYTITLELGTTRDISTQELKNRLMNTPRIFLSPEGVDSTADIERMRKILMTNRFNYADIPPIVIYSDVLEGSDKAGPNTAMIFAVIDSTRIAAYANIDSIRTLSTNLSAMESMRKTDQYAGFVNQMP